MSTKLVIVESPAKAKTIGSYLGADYDVLASVGHIRDLLPNGKSLPPEIKKMWWSDYAVDVDNGFEPIYEVPSEKAAQVKRLRDAMKGKDTLVLATDEDREGESISWHLLEVLKPNKNVAIKRIAFHEITKDAILHAMDNPRQVDMDLVEAQETRRVLDRLYGYTLSPVLWSRVMRNLSAGRVQTPAVKLIVDRERARGRFMSSTYWDLEAEFKAENINFKATLKQIDGQRLATGADFDDETGELKATKKDPRLQLQEVAAKALATKARDAKPWKVRSIEANEGAENPAAPFMTTTLQQDANRKFGFSADRTMRVAQTLYEGVTMGGEQTGLITYMRTDSLTLSTTAIEGIRNLLKRDYSDCLPDKPRVYTSKVRNAQEAHEAIRPTEASRRPNDVAKYLNDDQFRIYDLIWKRAVASQMKSARVLKTEAEIEVKADNKDLIFLSTGKQILFDGFRRLYMESFDDGDSDKVPGESRLPKLSQGLVLENQGVDALGHSTKPPARYTDATIIKKLEENGIGRPSTYASIISVIVDRGYVRKAGKQLIPTFKAYLTMEVLEGNFEEFTELGFTRTMDDALDDIAGGRAKSKDYLGGFFMGPKGLKTVVEERKKEIPYPAVEIGKHPETGQDIVVRLGTSGNAFLQLGPREDKNFANVPEDLPPADLNIAKALELLETKTTSAESVGTDPNTGRRLLLRNRQGFYLEVERTQEEIDEKVKPTWISVPPGADPRQMTQEELDSLTQLPRTIGNHPETGEPIVFKIGKFGAYIESGVERRTVENWKSGMTMNVEEAAEILKQPKFRAARSAPAAPLREFEAMEGTAGPMKVLSGRFGAYVTDGETNATLPKSMNPEELTAEQAADLIRNKKAAGPSARPVRRGAKKPIKKAVAKKPAAKKK